MTDEEENGFPKELLRCLPSDRSKYFREYTVDHPILRSGFDKAWRILHQSGGKQIVLVIGPGRSGKTFLSRWLEEELKYEWAPQQSSDPGRIPVVSIEVPARDTLRPSWTTIYELILRRLEEPLIDKKIVYADVTLYPTSDGKFKISDKTRAAKYGLAVVEAIQHRRPTLFFDEFHHVLGWPGVSYQDQMDCVKSIANRGGTKLVLFATYEALELFDLSDQAMCRTKPIHLRRYGLSDEDYANFEGTVNSFQINLPFHHEPDLLKHLDYLYERTNGRIGLLAIWLQEAADLALEEGASTVKVRHLKQTEPLTRTQALKMLSKLEQSENRYVEVVGEESGIDEEELDEEVHNDNKTQGQGNDASETTQMPKSQGRGRSRKVGERNPGRDLTGRGKDGK